MQYTHPIAGTHGVVGLFYVGASPDHISGGGSDGGSPKILATDANVSTATETQPKNYLINKYILI